MKTNGSQRQAPRVTTLIIGAGHAGLAMSHCLSERSIDHLILERGKVANSWRTERWDSLRLLTPNWQSRLPGHRYESEDANGYMSMTQLVDFISEYAQLIDAPIYTQTEVISVQPMEDGGYWVLTNRGEWCCRTLVLASGACNTPVVPMAAQQLPEEIVSFTPHQYRNPEQLAEGGVLVVGASATGLQITDEIQRSGRPVTLAVGEHVRMPRNYRGKDILHWMEVTGLFDEGYKDVDDIRRIRRLPSPQLIGTPERSTLDLNALISSGVSLVGRFSGIHGNSALFSGGLANNIKLADLKMGRLLKTIDEWIDQQEGLEVEPAENSEPTKFDSHPRLEIDLTSGEIKTIIWATGFRPDYSWLDVPVLDRKGMLRHDGGVVDSPGMYVLGLPFLRRRKSSFIHGAEDDTRDVTNHLVNYLG